MNKKICKRILGLFIFTFALVLLNLFAPLGVEASDKCDKAKQDFVTNAIDRYGLSIEYIKPSKDRSSGNYFKVSMASSVNDSPILKKAGITNPRLKIYQITFYTPNQKNSETAPITMVDEYVSSSTITPGKSITINRNKFGGNVKKGMRLYFKTDGFVDPTLKAACNGNIDYYMTLDAIIDSGTGNYSAVEIAYNLPSPSSLNAVINCAKYSGCNDNSFECKFCKDREAAINSENRGESKLYQYDKDHLTYASKYAGDTKSKKLEFKCDYDKFQPDDKSKYYVNKKYVRGVGTFEVTAGEYHYNTELPSTVEAKSDAARCTIKCEEIVTVEYGAPIASKAGLCFEYKVKVTSRVNCGIDGEPTKPRQAAVCTPLPYCISTRHEAYAQGGPSEDFDKCVKSCDGGKYTDKCTNKCYKKVYGNTVKTNKSSGKEISYAKKIASNSDENACRYVWDDGYILWKFVNENGEIVSDGNYIEGKTCQSWWHTKFPFPTYWGIEGHVYNVMKDGIPATKDCHDTCYWFENDSDICRDPNYAHYLNGKESWARYHNTMSQYEKDIIANTQTYNNLLKKCEAYASCNTTTAEFTISVDYTTKNSTKVKTINFPYSTSKTSDKIKYNDGDSVSCTDKNLNSTLLSSNGCYNCGKANSDRFYQTEWSFPGTWIHNKTGEITYKPKTDKDKSWQKQEDKFCLPLNIRDVNTKWYNYYYSKKYGNDTSISYNSNESIVCPDGSKAKYTGQCDYRNTTFNSSDVGKITYNINAIAKRFGMYEWDIDIKCFYAVNSNFPSTDENKCKKVCENNKTTDDSNNNDKYRIRTVDLANMFPDSEGNKLTSTSNTGRTPGFNWNQYSSQTTKDPQYTSVASNYTKWVQAKGYSVYSDDYLDYEVTLTKDDINSIKKKDRNYTEWSGDTETNSVVNYRSDLIRKKIKNAKYPNGQALKCNNMKNWKSSECEDFTGEVK